MTREPRTAAGRALLHDIIGLLGPCEHHGIPEGCCWRLSGILAIEDEAAAAAQVRTEALEAALLGVREAGFISNPCWCPYDEDETGTPHSDYCLAARAALAPQEPGQ